MRTIKFRGKKHNNGDWVFGSLHNYSPIGNSIYVNSIENETTEGFTVYSHTVGQFTGLPDKNGKEIYEGDILEDSLGRRKVVEYYQDGFWLNASLEGAEWSLRHTHKSSKIIGNIYENPELLSN